MRTITGSASTSSRSSRRLLVAVLVTLASGSLALGACSSNDSTTATSPPPATAKPDDTTGTTVGTTVPAGTGTTTGTGDRGEADTSTTTATTGETTRPGDGPSTNPEDPTDGSDGSDGGSTDQPTTTLPTSVNPTYATFCGRIDQIRKQFEDMSMEDMEDEAGFIRKVKAAFQEMTDTAPEPVKADFVTYNQWIQAINSMDDSNDLTAEAQEASSRIDTWSAANCGKPFDG